MPNIYDFSIKSLDGKPVSMADFSDRPMLIVNGEQVRVHTAVRWPRSAAQALPQARSGSAGLSQ
jgi:hypothetical protein